MAFKQNFYIDYIFITFKSATSLLVGVALQSSTGVNFFFAASDVFAAACMEGAQLMTCTVRTYHHRWSDHAHVQYNGTKPNWWQQQQGHPKHCWQQIKLAPVMYLIYLSQSIIDQFRLNQWHSITKSNLR